MKIEMVLVPVRGDPHTITVDVETPGPLQRHIGGWLEAIGGQGWSAYFDEEGKIKGLPMNTFATAYAIALGWNPMSGDYLAGPVVFCGPPDSKGYDTPVSHRVKSLIFSVTDPWSSGR